MNKGYTVNCVTIHKQITLVCSSQCLTSVQHASKWSVENARDDSEDMRNHCVEVQHEQQKQRQTERQTDRQTERQTGVPSTRTHRWHTPEWKQLQRMPNYLTTKSLFCNRSL